MPANPQSWMKSARKTWEGLPKPFGFASKDAEARFHVHFFRTAPSRTQALGFVFLPMVFASSAAAVFFTILAQGRLRSMDNAMDYALSLGELTEVGMGVGAVLCVLSIRGRRSKDQFVQGRTLLWRYRLLRGSLAGAAFTGRLVEGKYMFALVVDTLLGCQIHYSLREQLLGFLLILVLPHMDTIQTGKIDSVAPVMATFLALSFMTSWYAYSLRRKEWLQMLATSTLNLAVKSNRSIEKAQQLLQKRTATPQHVSRDAYWPEKEWAEVEEQAKREFLLCTERSATIRDSAQVNLVSVTNKILGEGGYGSISLAINTRTKEYLALKEVVLSGRSSNAEKILANEINMLKCFEHPNIIKYEDAEIRNGNLCLIMEYIEDGSLKDFLMLGPMPEPLACSSIYQILNGLSYLHLIGVAHRDIKPPNIMIDKGMLKIVDFGAAVWIYLDSGVSYHGTKAYMAPEIAKGYGHGRQVDVWAVGCCLLEMLTLQHLFENSSEVITEYRALLSNLKEMPPLPAKVSGAAKEFIQQCFQLEPSNRPTAHALMKHKFMENQELKPIPFKMSRKTSDEQLQTREDGSPVSLWDSVQAILDQWKGTFPDPKLEAQFEVYVRDQRIPVVINLIRVDHFIRACMFVPRAFITPIWVIDEHKIWALAVCTLGPLSLYYPVSTEKRQLMLRWVLRIGLVVEVLVRPPEVILLLDLQTYAFAVCVGQICGWVFEIIFWFAGYTIPRLYLLGRRLWVMHFEENAPFEQLATEMERVVTSASVLLLFYFCAMGYNNYLFKIERHRFLRKVYRGGDNTSVAGSSVANTSWASGSDTNLSSREAGNQGSDSNLSLSSDPNPVSTRIP